MTLRVYADRSALPEGMQPVQLLYPFWGAPDEDPRDPTAGRYDVFLATAHEYLVPVEQLEEADIAVYPAPWELVHDLPDRVEEACRLARAAEAAGKPFVIFFVSDSAELVPVDGALVFRTSLYRSHGRRGELAMPAWSEDFVERYLGGSLDVRPWRKRPLVGFRGFDTPWPSPAKHMAKRLLGRRAVSSRGRALRALRADPRVETEFVVRDSFFGGSVSDGLIDYDAMKRARREYVQTLVDCDYALAARGSETWGSSAGNFSYRLYEVLSCGRVPLFVNTDCVLPFDWMLDWTAFTVFVDESELGEVANLLLDRHNALDDGSFDELQREARRIWVEYLSPHGFFRQFYRHFEPGSPGARS